MKKTFIQLFISIISIGIFWWLESGFALRNGDELVKSSIFAASLFIILTGKYKRFILKISLLLLIIMIILYLFWQIPLSNLFGSIGFGMFLIFVLSYIPNLVKKGFVEEL